MPAPSLTYTLSNGSVADASQVMQNFNDIINGITDGTKDLSINALTLAGTLTANGSANLGNSSGDDLSITASLASSIAIKTNNSYDIGSATLGIRKLFLGNAGAGATCDIVSASHATTREYTIPDCGAAASFVMSELAQTIAGAKTYNDVQTYKAVGGTIAAGSYSTAGAWTLGPSGLTGYHVINGRETRPVYAPAYQATFNNLSSAGYSILQISTSGGNCTLNGITDGVAGQVIYVAKANSANTLTISYNSGSATAGNRILTRTAADITLGAGGYGGLVLVYIGSDWFALTI